MSLYSFHRVLISAAILFDFFFTFWAVRQYRANGDVMDLVMGIGSSVFTIGLVAYLVYFNRNLTVHRHMIAARHMGNG
jgi:steroid 5-alpha reductase family enzyme